MKAISVSKAIGRSRTYTYRLLQKNNIPTRESQESPYYEERINGIRKVYSDPVRKAEVLAKIHTPEALSKRSAIISQRYAEDNLFRDRVNENLKKAREASKEAGKKRWIERENAVNEQIRLQAERELQFAQGLREIPAYRMLSPRQRQVIELRYRTDGGDQLTSEEICNIMGGISRQAIHQYEKMALIKLGIFIKSKPQE